MTLNYKSFRNNVAIIFVIFIFSFFQFSLNDKLLNKNKQIVSRSFSCKENGEYNNIYIINKVLKTCLTVNNNSQAYLASCNGSQNQQWNVKYDDQTSDLSIFHSLTGWALEFYIPDNLPITKKKFPRLSYEYICDEEKYKNLFLNGLPIITAPVSGKVNQKFSFKGFAESFIFKPKECLGTVSINPSDPNNIVGIHNDVDLRNKNLNLWAIRKFNFSPDAKNNKEQKPQILRNLQTNECLTINKKGEVFIRRCLGIDKQLWFVDRINQMTVLRNKENNLSLDVKDNRLVTSTYNEFNRNQKWLPFLSYNYPGYLMLTVNFNNKKCVSFNLNNWNDDYLYLEKCDPFNKMQQFKFEIFNENPIFYNNIMPYNNLETRYFINKGTGLCVDVSDKNVIKNVECKDIHEQKFAILSSNIQDAIEVNKELGYKNILIYNPKKSNPSSISISPYSGKIIRGGVTSDFYLRYIFSEVYPDAFQLTNNSESDFTCLSVKKEESSFYILSGQVCDPTNKYQHWQLVRVQDLGKDLTPKRPIKNNLPSKCDENSIITLKGELRNGTNDLPIPTSRLEGSTLEFKSKEGNKIPSTIEGSKYIVNLKKGIYSVTINTKNFSEFKDDVIIKNEKDQEKNFLLSPSSIGEIRVILSWNNALSDLDLWAMTNNNENIYYNNKSSHDGTIKLDIDKREGMGPKTISVHRNNKDEIIRFMVHNYSKKGLMSLSEANAKIYFDNKLIENLNIPISSDSSLIWWELGTFHRLLKKFLKVDKLIKEN